MLSKKQKTLYVKCLIFWCLSPHNWEVFLLFSESMGFFFWLTFIIRSAQWCKHSHLWIVLRVWGQADLPTFKHLQIGLKFRFGLTSNFFFSPLIKLSLLIMSCSSSSSHVTYSYQQTVVLWCVKTFQVTFNGLEKHAEEINANTRNNHRSYENICSDKIIFRRWEKELRTEHWLRILNGFELKWVWFYIP